MVVSFPAHVIRLFIRPAPVVTLVPMSDVSIVAFVLAQTATDEPAVTTD